MNLDTFFGCYLMYVMTLNTLVLRKHGKFLFIATILSHFSQLRSQS